MYVWTFSHIMFPVLQSENASLSRDKKRLETELAEARSKIKQLESTVAKRDAEVHFTCSVSLLWLLYVLSTPLCSEYCVVLLLCMLCVSHSVGRVCLSGIEHVLSLNLARDSSFSMIVLGELCCVPLSVKSLWNACYIQFWYVVLWLRCFGCLWFEPNQLSCGSGGKSEA